MPSVLCCLTQAAHNYTRAVNQVAARKQNLLYSIIRICLAFSVAVVSYLLLSVDIKSCMTLAISRMGAENMFLTVCPCLMQLMFINIFVVQSARFLCYSFSCIMNLSVLLHLHLPLCLCVHEIFLCNSSAAAAALCLYISIFWCWYFYLPFTYADDVHEAVHAVADLEEQVLTLPLGRRAEGGPDEPGDAGNEEQGTQNNGCYLHLLDHRQGDSLPLERKNVDLLTYS